MGRKRWKSGKLRKSKKILIRVNTNEKKLAEEMSNAENKNVSTLFRDMLRAHEKTNFEKELRVLASKYKKILKEYEKLIKK